ncbi:Predicted arabinose efflux permease, MFS family [Malonomonas rubra DSM 5091]|uniref:Predicted arabinose efflux permease, MFS family n=1 Tax=Malonomonas rubra DSM 5091 TaxID=1122189 RepID=A0A1M6HBK9_MALRU|nr:YbfB/YjiJ family MFS transporter [Malonomonas rubra]SHJ19648.1 Predicted arabinose efflux permease, MFS family [Malonomonas rubra DSM 5091]
MSVNDTQRNYAALKVLIGGMLGMVVAMGIGRFVYTPILPLMQRDLGISNSLAGGLATLNYLGYLLGALLCSFSPQLLRNKIITAGALFTSIATTFCMGLTLSVFWWSTMRLAGGVASAILFIVISAEVAEALSRRGFGHWLGALYGGIGAGIAISGLIVPQLDRLGGWSISWLGSGALAVVLAVLGISIGRRQHYTTPLAGSPPQTSGLLKSLWLLASAYFFQGLGYITTATFIVAIIATTPGLESFAAYSWVAVGVAALPSTIVWPLLAKRFGYKSALLAAYGLQMTGILVSIKAASIPTVLFAAVSFGGTFLGVVAMTLAEGNRRLPADSRRAAAVLTTCFSLGQMLGPLFSGVLADIQQGFELPLLLAAGFVAVGGALIAFDRRF